MSDKNREALLLHLWWQSKDLQRKIDLCRKAGPLPPMSEAPPLLAQVVGIAGQAASMHTVARALLSICAAETEE